MHGEPPSMIILEGIWITKAIANPLYHTNTPEAKWISQCLKALATFSAT